MTTTVAPSPSQSPPLAGVADPFPPEMDLTVMSRNPTRLSEATTSLVMFSPPPRPDLGAPRTSIILVTYNNLVFTRIALHALFAHTSDCEIIVVDNASTDATAEYLQSLPIRVISCKPAPLPPSKLRILALPSALPFPKKKISLCLLGIDLVPRRTGELFIAFPEIRVQVAPDYTEENGARKAADWISRSM